MEQQEFWNKKYDKDEFFYGKEPNEFLASCIKNFRKKERRFLELLIFNINKTVSSETITDYVWENEIRENYSLRQLVNGIRNKLPMNIIQTDIGLGYSIIHN